MTATAAAQLRRILALIPRLADGDEHAIADVAGAAGVPAADLLRDLEALSERFDAPGGFVDGVSIYVEGDTVCVSASQFLRPMRLTMPELCALELGLTMLRRERTPAEQGPIDRALERLRRTISRVPMDDRHEGIRFADLGVASPDSASHLSALRRAAANDRRVRLHYRAGGASETTTRTIDPQSLVFAEQMWYVVATTDDATLRFFRLDRIEDVEVLDESFARDPSAGSRVQEAGRVFASDTTRRMTVRYSPRIARWVAEREGVAVAEDGSLTLEHPVADESWAVRHVLQYGPDAEVLDPAPIRALVVAHLDRVAAERT
jgi:predicted DNA-binding transcriptional regulator YafY